MERRSVPAEKASRPKSNRRLRWERAAIVVPWVLSILSFLSGVIVFWFQQDAANRRPFLEKQLAVTFEAANATAILATTTDMNEWKQARRNLMRLEYGQLRIVENVSLSRCFGRFWKRLPKESANELQLPLRDLEQDAIIIADHSRALIAKSWNVDLKRLNDVQECR